MKKTRLEIQATIRDAYLWYNPISVHGNDKLLQESLKSLVMKWVWIEFSICFFEENVFDKAFFQISILILGNYC